MKHSGILLLAWICLIFQPGWAQDQVEIIAGTKPLDPSAGDLIGDDATLKLKDAGNLIKKTLGGDFLEKPDIYFIIHTIKWDKEGKVDAQNWYVYHNSRSSKEEFEGTRIFGSKAVALLYIHIDPSPESNLIYRVEVSKKLAAPVEAFLALPGLIPTAAARKGAPQPAKLWGGRLMTINHVPSDITVRLRSDSQEIAVRIFDNEGRYYWDISVGVPVSKLDELEYNAADGTVRKKEIDQQKWFALLNLYFQPKDTKSIRLSWVPHGVLGLGLSTKPLERIFAGLGWEIKLAHVYIGFAWNKIETPETLQTGSSATQPELEEDLKSRYGKAKFMVGINIPVREIVKLISANKKR